MAIPIAAEHLFSIGPIPVTNSVVTGWVAVAAFGTLGLALRKKASMVPRGIQNAAEALLEFMLGFMDQVTGSREKSRKFLPIVGSLFLFILFSNWLGLLPGVGSIGLTKVEGGHTEFLPLFRAATSDLNLTLAIGILSVVLSHVVGALSIGIWKHGGKFIQVGNVWRAIASIPKKKPGEAVIGVFTALIEFVVGLIELASEAAKMISLSLRLFGNIFAGEVLLSVLTSLVAYVVPLPFMALEIIVGVVQALVFSTLTLVYLTIASEEPHSNDEEHATKHAAAPAH
jgi:F-type H+-transporting ATPase subunit a